MPVAVTVMLLGSRWSWSLQVCEGGLTGELAVASVGEVMVKVALLAVPQLPPGMRTETAKVQVVVVQSEMVRRWPVVALVSVKAPHSPCQGDGWAWARIGQEEGSEGKRFAHRVSRGGRWARGARGVLFWGLVLRVCRRRCRWRMRPGGARFR